MMFTCT